MWIVCITSVRHVLTVNGYGGRQTKENEKSWCFKGWETLVINCNLHYNHKIFKKISRLIFLIEEKNRENIPRLLFKKEVQEII